MKIVTIHGEGKSVFYVVNEKSPEDEQPDVIACFFARQSAEDYCIDHGESIGSCWG